jgi:hypothetical protein
MVVLGLRGEGDRWGHDDERSLKILVVVFFVKGRIGIGVILIF